MTGLQVVTMDCKPLGMNSKVMNTTAKACAAQHHQSPVKGPWTANQAKITRTFLCALPYHELHVSRVVPVAILGKGFFFLPSKKRYFRNVRKSTDSVLINANSHCCNTHLAFNCGFLILPIQNKANLTWMLATICSVHNIRNIYWLLCHDVRFDI